MWLKQAFSDILDLLYPQTCDVCDTLLTQNESGMCLGCIAKMPHTDFHKVATDNPVVMLFAGRVNIAAATAWFTFSKGSNYRKLLHLLKYRNRPDVGVYLGKMLGTDLLESSEFAATDYIVPVPLHSKRFKKRGYNQSEQIALGISESMGIPVNTTSLLRISNNSTQTKKNRLERWQNVQQVFTVVQPKALENKTVLLIDDVITTGATIEACIEKLLQIPGIKVQVACLAVA